MFFRRQVEERVHTYTRTLCCSQAIPAKLAKKPYPLVSRHVVLNTASNGMKCRSRHVTPGTQKCHVPISIQPARLFQRCWRCKAQLATIRFCRLYTSPIHRRKVKVTNKRHRNSLVVWRLGDKDMRASDSLMHSDHIATTARLRRHSRNFDKADFCQKF